MDDKRYQVFVSSTYKDLIDERHSIMLTLMKMDCIPAGMEHFPAADEEQWNFIKRIIDYSDYYLLIIGGRYGSLDDDGLSFTEKEYDYAVSKNIKVIALIHGKPDALSYENSEQSPELRSKLEAFRDKVKTKRLVEFWTDPAELISKVLLGLVNAKSMYPAVGWTRSNRITNEENLSELIKAKDEIESLRKEVTELKLKSDLLYSGEIANFDSTFELHYNVGPIHDHYGDETKHATKVTWQELYHFMSPYIYKNFSTEEIFSKLTSKIEKENHVPNDFYTSIDESDLMTIELQFTALGLINTKLPRWKLTPKGVEKMLEVRIVK